MDGRTRWANRVDDDRRAQLSSQPQLAIPVDAIATAIGFAIAQPPSVDVDELVVRPTVQT